MTIALLGKKYNQSAKDLLLAAAQEFEKPQQRRHELRILTCYLDLSGIKRLLDGLIETIRITDVRLAFEFSEIFKDGPRATRKNIQAITKWCANQNIAFQATALSASALVHTKGYSIQQRVQGNTTGGIVLITSANFTDAGFFGARNVEIAYASTKLKDIKDFESKFDALLSHFNRSLDEKIKIEDLRTFRYSLLSSGLFLHKWNGSLSRLLNIKYELTPLVKARAQIPEELTSLGFQTGDTFSRDVLKVKELPKKDIPPRFTKAFTIETSWGRWCPRATWDEARNHLLTAEPFINDFREATTEEILDVACDEAQGTQDSLISRGLIEAVSPGNINVWKERILALRENKEKLERLFCGYEAHQMPFDIKNHNEIEDLYDSLVTSIELHGKKIQ
jgi:hypothetical protein